MKAALFGVLAFCLVFAHASLIREDPVEGSVKTLEGYADSLNEKADQIAKGAEQKYDEVVVQPIERVEAAVLAIEERKEESEECVDQQAAEVEVILANFEATLDTCTQEASNSGLSLAVGITKTTIEITNDTYKLVTGVQRCRRYTNSILKSTCYAKQLVRAKMLVSKTKKAVESLNQSVDETVPMIVVDLEACSASAEQNAQAQLELINRNIDGCLGKF